MTMKTHIHILLTILIAATCTSVTAQTDTLQGSPLYQNVTADPIEGELSLVNNTLTDTIETMFRQLHSMYSAGKFHDALQVSREIADLPQLSKEQNQDLLKYTISTYKSLDYDHEADSIAKQYLTKDPFYNPDEDKDAPVLFTKVINNYYTAPKYSVWAAIGKHNVETFHDTIRTIIDTTANARKPEYNITGFSVQLGFEYRPSKIVSISLAPSVTTYELNRTINRTDIAKFHYNETSIVFALPLYVEAALPLSREIVVPSVYAGAQMKFLVRSEYTAYTEAIGTYTEVPDMQSSTDLKNRFNYSFLGGVRIKHNRRRMTYFSDLGMSLDMLPYNDPKKIYSNYDLLYNHFHVPDIFQMLEYTVKVGIQVNLQYKTIAKNNYGY